MIRLVSYQDRADIRLRPNIILLHFFFLPLTNSFASLIRTRLSPRRHFLSRTLTERLCSHHSSSTCKVHSLFSILFFFKTEKHLLPAHVIVPPGTSELSGQPTYWVFLNAWG